MVPDRPASPSACRRDAELFSTVKSIQQNLVRTATIIRSTPEPRRPSTARASPPLRLVKMIVNKPNLRHPILTLAKSDRYGTDRGREARPFFPSSDCIITDDPRESTFLFLFLDAQPSFMLLKENFFAFHGHFLEL